MFFMRKKLLLPVTAACLCLTVPIQALPVWASDIVLISEMEDANYSQESITEKPEELEETEISIVSALDSVNKLLRVIQSDEFMDLVSYSEQHEEVRDLMATLIDYAIQLIKNDRGTANKILEIFGIDSCYIDLFDSVVEAEESADAFLKKYLSSQELEGLKSMLDRYMTDEQTAQALKDLYVAITGPEAKEMVAADAEKLDAWKEDLGIADKGDAAAADNSTAEETEAAADQSQAEESEQTQEQAGVAGKAQTEDSPEESTEQAKAADTAEEQAS